MVAVPKGRIPKRARGAACARWRRRLAASSPNDRRLVRGQRRRIPRFLLLKPDDVPTYVEYGAADLGVCGRDVLLERRYDLYQPLDLGIGRCRMVVAASAAPRYPRCPGWPPNTRTSRRATSRSRGIQAEIIYVQGSVELAPLVGLAHLIVDLVETGTTLVENNLEERELVAEVSSVLVANRAQFKLRRAQIEPLLRALRGAVVNPDLCSSESSRSST